MASESRELEFQACEVSREVSPFSDALQKGKVPRLWSTGTSVSARAQEQESASERPLAQELESVRARGHEEEMRAARRDSQQGLEHTSTSVTPGKKVSLSVPTHLHTLFQHT
jgi:hypothetical protein